MSAAPETKAADTPARMPANNPKRYGKTTVSNDRLQLGNDAGTTLGFSIFRDPISAPLCLADIRERLELKYVACLALDGLNGHPVDADRIVNPQLRSLGAVSRLLKNWSVRDLAEVDGLPALTAEAVLIATLENPVWGEDDVALIYAIERLENLQAKAERSGRTL